MRDDGHAGNLVTGTEVPAPQAGDAVSTMSGRGKQCRSTLAHQVVAAHLDACATCAAFLTFACERTDLGVLHAWSQQFAFHLETDLECRRLRRRNLRAVALPQRPTPPAPARRPRPASLRAPALARQPHLVSPRVPASAHRPHLVPPCAPARQPRLASAAARPARFLSYFWLL